MPIHLPYDGHWTAGEPQPAEDDRGPSYPRHGSVPYDVASLLRALVNMHVEMARQDRIRTTD